MTTDSIPAFGASPLFRFLFQESADTMLPDKCKVLYHTHMVKSTVSLIERFKPAAWEIAAFIAEADKPFTQQFALMAHESAVFAAWPAAGAIRFMETLLLQVVLHCQVVGAYTTVHPAGSDKFFTHL